MGDEGVDAHYVCNGCHRAIISGGQGHGPGCMLREDKKWVERRRGVIQRFPGMKNVCERCGHLMHDKALRHDGCPKRLPD